jgi:hypothetical protein
MKVNFSKIIFVFKNHNIAACIKISSSYLAVKLKYLYLAYYIAIGYYRTKDYEACIKKTEQILRLEKENHQAKDLNQEATKLLRKEGLIGMGIAAGAASMLGGLAVAGLAVLASKVVKK